MAPRFRRPWMSAPQKAELWRRWRQGQSLAQIARVLGYTTISVRGVVVKRGGFPPPERRRAARTLTLLEREEISRGLNAGFSLRGIAGCIGRSPSTVGREVARNGGRWSYRAAQADAEAWTRALRPKPCKLATQPQLRQLVAGKLAEDWSPEQISGWLDREYPMQRELHVSPETIYRSLFIQARGVLKAELVQHLRSRRTTRRAQKSRVKGHGKGQIIDGVSIRERPAAVDDRAVPGHWEGDLIAGSRRSYIATLVERQSRFTMLVKIAKKDTLTVTSALAEKVKKLPVDLRGSLTWDRGLEMAAHKQFTVATDVQVYFCDPSSPWQRGTNENTNRLLRQYFPKTADLSAYSQEELDLVANRLNQRPRKTLDFQTPADRLREALH